MHASIRRTLVLSTLFALMLALTAHAQTPVVEAEADDGTTLLQLNDDGGFTVFGEYNSGTGVIPSEGEGTRLTWYPEKAAFRAGRVNGSQWDDDNIGQSSTALSYNSIASGRGAMAMGYLTEASGNYSTAMGYSTIASGFRSTAMGYATEASGGYAPTAIGYATTASGTSSTAMGHSTTASGYRSTAMGYETIAASAHSLSAGLYNDANQTDDGTLFVVGNGSSTSRSDALVLDENGNLEIAGNLTESSDRRLKTDIEPMDENVLEALSKIQAVHYRFREGTGHPTDAQIGLIAQEVQKQFPELVREGSDGHLALSYSKLTAVLVKGLQEQQDENEALEARIATLEQMMQDRTPVAARAGGYAPLLTAVLLLLGGALVLHRRRSAA